jgi:hypothetical protein
MKRQPVTSEREAVLRHVAIRMLILIAVIGEVTE